MAWDLRRTDWRTFRLDRLGNVELGGKRFSRRPIPGGDAAEFLSNSLTSIPTDFEAESCVGV